MSRKWSNSLLSWCMYSHFNEAETKMSRKSLTAILKFLPCSPTSMRPRQKCLGNSHITILFWFSSRTSMRPRQKCLGNGRPARRSRSEGRYFNEAETKMSRKFGWPPGCYCIASYFNEAETKMSRKLWYTWGCRWWIFPLQWGRDKNVSEMI